MCTDPFDSNDLLRNSSFHPFQSLALRPLSSLRVLFSFALLWSHGQLPPTCQRSHIWIIEVGASQADSTWLWQFH